LSNYIEHNSSIEAFNKQNETSWSIISKIEQRIKNKIENAGIRLSDWDIEINYGIKTGYNEAL
jgi:adenine-specific DNA-methyltransferase